MIIWENDQGEKSKVNSQTEEIQKKKKAKKIKQSELKVE